MVLRTRKPIYTSCLEVLANTIRLVEKTKTMSCHCKKKNSRNNNNNNNNNSFISINTNVSYKSLAALIK